MNPIRPEDMIDIADTIDDDKSATQTNKTSGLGDHSSSFEDSQNNVQNDIKEAISYQENSLNLLRKIEENMASCVVSSGTSVQIAELQSRVKKLEEERESLLKIINTKETESLSLNSHIKSLLGEISNLKDCLSAEDDVIEKVKKEKSLIETDLQKKTKEFEEQECELEIKQDEINKLVEQLSCVNEEKSRLQEELIESDKVRAELSKQVEDARTQIEFERITAEKHLKECKERTNGSIPNVRCYPQEAVKYASCSLRLIDLIYASFQKLDDVIKLYYQDNDDANYFYLRRRLKFLEAGGDFSVMRKWAGELDSFVKTGFVVIGSPLQKAFGDTTSFNISAVQYYLYTNLFKHIAGPGIILIREIQNMDIYTGVSETSAFQDLKDIEKEMLQCVNSLGLSVVDVELFKPLPLSENIDCIEKVSNKLPGTKSGDVIEITKLAVLYGNVKDNTEVKIES